MLILLVDALPHLLVFHLVVSFILFLWPNLLHRKHYHRHQSILLSFLPNKILLIAHRGGSLLALENTFQSFDKALSVGADVLEMDVCVTRDQEIVVCHDPILTRLCNRELAVDSLDFDQLPPH